MKRRIYLLSCLMLGMIGAGNVLLATDLWWAPNTERTSNRADLMDRLNWTNSVGQYVKFTQGDNIYFLDTGTTWYNVNMALMPKPFRVGHLYVENNDREYQFQQGQIGEMLSFIKRGSKTLRISASPMSYTNDVHVQEGTLLIYASNTLVEDYPKSPYGNLNIPHTIYVGTGDVNNMGTLSDYPANGRLVIASPEKDIQLRFVFDAGRYYSGGQGSYMIFPSTILRNGSELGVAHGIFRDALYIARNTNGTASVESTLSMGGSSNSGDRGFLLSAEGVPFIFDVTEVTSEDGTQDDLPDFKCSLVLSDRDEPLYSTRSEWEKRGSGTMVIHWRDKNTTAQARYTGDISIREGVVSVQGSTQWNKKQHSADFYGGSMMGYLFATNRTFTIHEGATLAYDINQALSFPTVNSEYENPTMTTVISNGTLRIRGINNLLGNVTILGTGCIDNGDDVTLSGYHLYPGEKMTFQTQDPYLFDGNLTSGKYCIYLGCYADTELVGEERRGFTDFCVHEAEVMDGLADVTTRASFSAVSGYTAGYRCGLKKSGEGVMSIEATQSDFNYTTLVSEGGLWLEGANARLPKDVVVQAGGAIGGTGKIGYDATHTGDLVIEEGGGLMVDAARQDAHLTLYSANADAASTLTIPQAGEVLLLVGNYEGDLEAIGETLDAVNPWPTIHPDYGAIIDATTGTPIASVDDIDVSQWKVKVRGFTEKACRKLAVRKNGDSTLSIRYRNDGIRIIVR